MSNPFDQEEDDDLLNMSGDLLLDEKTPDLQSIDKYNQNNLVTDSPQWDNYENLEVIGEGSYGKIFKVREKNGERRIMVIKQIDTGQVRKDYEALVEIDVMARMDSPYIVKYYDSFIT